MKFIESGRGRGIAPVTPPTPPGMRVCLAALTLRAAYRLAVSLRSAAPGGSDETYGDSPAFPVDLGLSP